jgi:T-lymphoma invasion and metastasis-inducing protein 1
MCDVTVCRLWAEVFHVSASGAGTVKWQQVSEDLVPVNITCIQDSPECVFHITAYNSQVDKILDVRLVQPGNVALSATSIVQSSVRVKMLRTY